MGATSVYISVNVSWSHFNDCLCGRRKMGQYRNVTAERLGHHFSHCTTELNKPSNQLASLVIHFFYILNLMDGNNNEYYANKHL